MVENLLRKNRIHIIDATESNEVAEEITNTIHQWDIMSELITEESIKEIKIILAQFKPDFIQPFRMWGSYIPFVIYSTHPEYTKNWRLDKGHTELSIEAGYLVILISPNGKSIISNEYYLNTSWKDQNFDSIDKHRKRS